MAWDRPGYAMRLHTAFLDMGAVTGISRVYEGSVFENLKIQCVGLGSFSLAAAPALLLCRFIFHWCIKWSREDMTLSNGHTKANYFHISSCNISARHYFYPVLRWLLFLFSRPLWIIHHCLFQLSSALPKLVFCHNEGAAPSFLLPANPFPPQLRFHKNSCTFSISCKLRYEPQIHCVC